MNILTSALGHYEATGNPDEADCVIGHSFGTRTEEGSVNRSLAKFILQNAHGRPIVADRMLANAFPNPQTQVSYIVEGPISNSLGKGLGTWGTLVKARTYTDLKGLSRPLMVGQAYHIGRVVMQATKLGIISIVPPGLPRQFEPKSGQRWTRSLLMWVPREVVGSIVLRAQQRL